MRGIHRSPVHSPHKGQWHRAFMFSLICAWTNGWANHRYAGDLRRHRTHYDVTVMKHHACAKSKSFGGSNGGYSWSITVGLSSLYMMTSSNGNIFRVTGPLCGEFTGPGEFPTQRPVTRNFDVFFDLNKRLSKQPWGWWFETLSWSLWRQRNDMTGASLTVLFIILTSQ